ncbi:hypothetical protein D3C71_1304510 [compost metagenome]
MQSYMAMSAFWISCCGRSPSCGARAMPMLVVTANSSLPNRNGVLKPRVIASARRSGWSAWSRVSHTTRNSSPPKRASRPSVPIAVAMRRVASISSSSPALWPSRSLTVLKRSRSMYSTATRQWVGLAMRVARSLSTASRFMMPVSGSVRAWMRRVSSACLRAVMSCTVPAMRAASTSPASASPIMRTQNECPSLRWPCSSSSNGTCLSITSSSACCSCERSSTRRHSSRWAMSCSGSSWPRMRLASSVRYRRCRPRSHSQPPMCASDWARSNRALVRLSSVMSLNIPNT